MPREIPFLPLPLNPQEMSLFPILFSRTHKLSSFPHTGFTCSSHALRYELYLSNLFWQNSPKHSLCVHLLVITQPETFIITQVNLRWSRVAVLHARTHDTKYDKLGTTYKLHITTHDMLSVYLHIVMIDMTTECSPRPLPPSLTHDTLKLTQT